MQILQLKRDHSYSDASVMYPTDLQAPLMHRRYDMPVKPVESNKMKIVSISNARLLVPMLAKKHRLNLINV